MEHSLDRRTFTLEFALAALSGVVITISGCGGGSYGSPSGPSGGSSGDKVGSISNNHNHRAVITSAQLTAGNALTIDIQYQATHSHTVTLSAAEVMAIAANQRVSTNSSVGDADAHNHTVTFN